MSATIFVHLAGSKAWNATPPRFLCGEECPPRLRERAQAELDASEGSIAGASLAVLMPALASSVPSFRVAAAEAVFYELTDRCDKMAQYMDHVVPDAALGLIRVEPCKGCLANVRRILDASGTAAKGGKAFKGATAADADELAPAADGKWWDKMSRTTEASSAGVGPGRIATSVGAPKPIDPRQAKADKRWSTPAKAKPAKAKKAKKKGGKS